MAQSPLQRIVAALKTRYGAPTAPPAGRDPLALMFYEMVAYLADDDTRERTFATLKKRVGLAPKAVRGTPLVVLTAICRDGGPVQPEHRARRMAEVAAIAEDEFDGNLAQVLTWDYAKAVRALRRFPSVAEPGADRILMLCGSHAVLGMESNALRVLCRLGYGEETKNYTKTYRTARDAAMAELPKRANAMAEASLLLREHGKETCKTSAPRCEECPVTAACAWFNARRAPTRSSDPSPRTRSRAPSSRRAPE